ncbi:MAG: dipeptide ABC transporter ATP-binding protein [Burkholderiaceae bacterium]
MTQYTPTLPELSEQSRVLDVNRLTVKFRTDSGLAIAVRDVSLTVNAGETLALVGESGSGKSVTALSVMRLVEHGGGQITDGDLTLRRRDGRLLDLARAKPDTLRAVRGADVAMIFQEPMTSLNPVFTAGRQIAESLVLHRGLDDGAALAEAVRMLDLVRIPDAKRIAERYPHQLSGGMRQRVMIAMALACKPQLLIADEPTTALDVTVQAQILALIRSLQDEVKMGVLFITHDMGVVAEVADRVAVMRYGAVVEEGRCEDVFARPQHAYTRALLAAVPRLGAMRGTDAPRHFELVDSTTGLVRPTPKTALPAPGATVLSVKNIVKRFPVRTDFFGRTTHQVHACEKVSFDLAAGETLALVGESGCGKSTTGRAVLRLLEIDSGQIDFGGRDLAQLRGNKLKPARRDMQMIFQDPFASLDPRVTVGYSIAEPLLIHGVASAAEADEKVAALLRQVGLSPDMARRYPHEFSGGQRQRVCIARALALNPKVIVADEAVAALDVSIRAQVINLMLDLQAELGLSYLFISHDMGVVERVSHRVAVMYLGQIVEIGPRRAVLENPQHPYTRKLLDAVPVPDPARRNRQRSLAAADLPSPVRAVGNEPEVVPLERIGAGHYVARHRIGGDY